MALTLYYHPLSSFCHKVLIALYENDVPFEARQVNLGEAADRALLRELWPPGKFPVLHDSSRGRTLPETSIIIEYLDRHYPGAHPLLPVEPHERLQARLWDRVFDLHVQVHVQKIVGDRLRAAGEQDPRGVADARAALATAYGLIDQQLAQRPFAVGTAFSMADCAAAPALFYATIVAPPDPSHRHLAAYFERLVARPSVARVLTEARPWFKYFPYLEAMPARFLAG